jgi:hypothetical protein
MRFRACRVLLEPLLVERASAREGGWSTDLARFHLRENVSRADAELAAQIAKGEAPFWRHVLDALTARRR